MNKSDISIHAPKRERRPASPAFTSSTLFQSTLPNGSDRNIRRLQQHVLHFNPRSQTGATYDYNTSGTIQLISIHAPKRERPRLHDYPVLGRGISIHAPKRERRVYRHQRSGAENFNPRSQTGATACLQYLLRCPYHFNPRSQTGATLSA